MAAHEHLPKSNRRCPKGTARNGEIGISLQRVDLHVTMHASAFWQCKATNRIEYWNVATVERPPLQGDRYRGTTQLILSVHRESRPPGLISSRE